MEGFAHWLSAMQTCSKEDMGIRFDPWLLLLRLPRISRGTTETRQPRHSEDVDPIDKLLMKLFSLLDKFEVKKVWNLDVADDTHKSTSDVLIATFLKRLHVEALNWRKPDLDIDQLLSIPDVSKALCEIHLYSGNVPSFMYWCGEDGLIRFPRVCSPA
jgi:hypothetical protein